jgi:hypothetical protein
MKPSILKLDKLWQECIHKKFHEKDIWKGGIGTDAHHIIHRSNGYSFRWCIEDGILLKHANHQYLHTSPGQEEFIIWFEKNYPGKYDELQRIAHNPKKVDLFEVEENLTKYLGN